MDKPLKLLIVDDDEVDRMTVRRALQNAGLHLEIDEESEPDDILDRVRSCRYDCILLDYSLPGTNGLEIIKAMRAANLTTPVIALTGQGNEDVAVALMKAGAADYLPKDRLEERHLAQRLRSAIRVHRAEERTREVTHELAAERELLKGVLEQMPDGIIIARAPGGELVLCNHQIEQILGQPYQRDDSPDIPARYVFRGKSDNDGRPDDLTLQNESERERAPEDRYEWPLARSVTRGEIVKAEELECTRPDGSRVFLHASSAPVRDSQDRVIAAVMILHDVTEDHHTHEALREEARLIETLHRIGGSLTAQLDQSKLVDAITREATQLTSAEFGVFYYNAISGQGETYVKHSSQGIEDGELSQLPSSGITPLLAQTFRSDSIVRVDDITRDARFATLQRDPEAPMLRSYMAVPVNSSSGRPIGGLFFGHSSAGAFSERDERIVTGIAAWAAVAMDNSRLYEAAQRALHVRDEVLAVVSHDLRNPLNAISIAAESLRQMELNAEQRERYTAAIRRGIERSNRLISDLLDASKIEAGKLLVEPGRVTVNKLLEQSARDHVMVADKRGVSLTVHVAEAVPKVAADAGRIRQVLDNLISNALRFTESGGRVELRAEAGPDGALITVADTGHGIPEQDLPQLFERYWQAKQQNRAGAGLGLYIAKGIIEAHGGHLSVDSKPGVGTTFKFTLPGAD